MACIVFDIIGIKGPEEEWNYSYRLSGYIAGIFSFGAIVALKKKNFRDYLEEDYNRREQMEIDPDGGINSGSHRSPT